MVQRLSTQQPDRSNDSQRSSKHNPPHPVTPMSLQSENKQFANTNGLSKNNACHNFLPAFRNEQTGEVALATFADGRQAPMHILLGLPASWATARNGRGQICAIASCVTAGFVRDGQFYTRAEAAAAID